MSHLQVTIPLSIFLSFLAIGTGGLVDETKTLDILDKVLLMTFLYNFFTTFFSFPSPKSQEQSWQVLLSLQILKIEGNRLKTGKERKKKDHQDRKDPGVVETKKIGNRIKLKGQDEEKKNDRLFPEYDYWSQILIMR